MTKKEVCALIRGIGVIPAIRVSSSDDAHFAAEAVEAGGIPIVEITMTVPRAVDLIAHLVRHHPKMVVGAGSLVDTETAHRCVDAGASFLTAPGFDIQIVQFAATKGITVLPGGMTPTEVVTAWKAGSDFVKVFPCGGVGGHKHIKALHTSLPQVSMIAAGGVNQQTAADYIVAGATAIGVGAELIPTEAIQRRQADRIHELAQRFVRFVEEGRERIKAWQQSVDIETFEETQKCEEVTPGSGQ
jgi:2-dehydro-3-deoxyphosphogluconate aldolase / (4S)-4-hydroxy-2-oxoglutarate aldolase